MANAEKILAILFFALSLYGIALVVSLATLPLHRLRIPTPPAWRTATRRGLMIRAGYAAAFGLFGGFQAIAQHLLSALFALPAIVLAGMLIAETFGNKAPRPGA